MIDWITNQVPGLMVGGMIGWITSWYFARASSKDTRQVWHSINMIARALEHSGFGKFNYDDKGNVTGVTITGQGHITGEGKMTGIGSFKVAPPKPVPVWDRQDVNPE